MNQQELMELKCQPVFKEGIPTYEFKVTRRIAHCSRCGHRFFKKDVRLRVHSAHWSILLCSTGECAEWFFKELLKRKGVI